MEIIKKYKIILIIIIIVVISGIAYKALFNTDKTKDLLTSDTRLSNEENIATIVENDLLSLLLDIRSVKLDGSIFTKETFNSLEDFGQEIIPELIGRENPFAPIGSEPATTDKSKTKDEFGVGEEVLE